MDCIAELTERGLLKCRMESPPPGVGEVLREATAHGGCERLQRRQDSFSLFFSSSFIQNIFFLHETIGPKIISPSQDPPQSTLITCDSISPITHGFDHIV